MSEHHAEYQSHNMSQGRKVKLVVDRALLTYEVYRVKEQLFAG